MVYSKELLQKAKARINEDGIGELLRLARKRHYNDLLHGHERGLWYDEESANKAVKFIEALKHTKGVWAGKNIILEEWQKEDIIKPIFGWMKRNEDENTKEKFPWIRRFKTTYDEVARKNGKSTLASGIGLKLAFGDKEHGAEVYAVATKKDQAKIVWNDAERMKNKCGLKEYVKTAYSTMTCDLLNSIFRPLGRDSNTEDGLNVHGSIVDEYHAHPDSEMRDVLRSGMGARLQALEMIITTAGFKRTSPCYEEREYAIKILKGVLENDSYHVFIASLDKGDDPFDPKNWKKANPNLGISLNYEDFKAMALEAKGKSSAYNNFLVKRLNVWTNSKEAWINYEKWEASGGISCKLEDLKGRVVYAGLDLSTTTDLTALVVISKREDGIFDVYCRFFMPKDTLDERKYQDKVPYSDWVREGFITATPGNVVDYDYVKDAVMEIANICDLKVLAYDRHNATETTNNLTKEGVEAVAFNQGTVAMNAPVKLLEKLVLSKKLNHGHNKVLNWMSSNAELISDSGGNVKFSKPDPRSIERIDGMVALCMALGAYLNDKKEEDVSPYETVGFRTI